jgi:hypothetical protein
MNSPSDEFLSLKKNRLNNLLIMQKAILEETRTQRERPISKKLIERLREGLEAVDRLDIWVKINQCNIGTRCGSIWCPICRNSAAKSSERKIAEYVNKHEKTNEQLLHVTGPVGLALPNHNDLLRIIAQDALRWKRIRKKRSFWIEATYEFELVNIQFLMQSGSSEMKQKQMRELQRHSQIRSNLVIFVHWHGITDLSRTDIGDVFGEEYLFNEEKLTKTSRSGLYIQKLHSEKNLKTNIEKIASYPFKSVYRYKHSFKGSDYTNGEYLTNVELGTLVSLYNDIQGRQWRSLRRNNGN